MPQLDALRLPPRSGGPADSLVVLLHGYGADGRDLIDIGELFAPLLPRAAFCAPHAPDPCMGAPVGRQWFPILSHDPHDLSRGAASALPALEAFIAQELAAHRMPRSRLVLMGFSQGCMMALEAGLAGSRPAAILGYSGLWVHAGGREAPRFEDAPPILLVHGDADEVVPPMALFASAYGLAGAGAAVQWHLTQGLGHGIDEEGLAIGGAFLTRALAAGA